MTKKCPFDKETSMEPWLESEHKDHVDTVLKCPKCGYIATFRKEVKEKPKKKEA